MTTIELKHQLKAKIDKTNNDFILKEVEKLLDEKIYILSEQQVLAIEEAREEYLRGETISHEQVMKDTDKWFKEQE